jgi:hypothetical protein
MDNLFHFGQTKTLYETVIFVQLENSFSDQNSKKLVINVQNSLQMGTLA